MKYIWWSYVKGMVDEYAMGKVGTSKTKLKEHESVRKAIEETERYKNGRDRLLVMRKTYKDKKTIAGAALEVPCHEQTAKNWHGDFIRAVARNFGLMD